MRPCRSFARLSDRAVSNLSRLRALADRACQDFPQRNAKVAIAHVVLNVQGAWSAFARSYFLSCVLAPRRRTKGRVTLGGPSVARSFNDAIGVVMGRQKPKVKPLAGGVWERRSEPAWHEPNVLRKGCLDLGCSHMVDVENALALQTGVFQHLPTFRNFFAHRCEETAASAKNIAPQYSIPSSLHPCEILTRSPFGRPFPLLVDWIDDLIVVIEFLCD